MSFYNPQYPAVINDEGLTNIPPTVTVASELETTGDNVEIGGSAPPVAGQVLVAQSPTAAAWGDSIAVGLKNAVDNVTTDTSPQPDPGFVLTATSDTTAEWTLNIAAGMATTTDPVVFIGGFPDVDFSILMGDVGGGAGFLPLHFALNAPTVAQDGLNIAIGSGTTAPFGTGSVAIGTALVGIENCVSLGFDTTTLVKIHGNTSRIYNHQSVFTTPAVIGAVATASQVLSGVLRANANFTFPSATSIVNAMPSAEEGDRFEVRVCNVAAAGTITMTAGAGMTFLNTFAPIPFGTSQTYTLHVTNPSPAAIAVY